jgi:hypothetical protein
MPPDTGGLRLGAGGGLEDCWKQWGHQVGTNECPTQQLSFQHFKLQTLLCVRLTPMKSDP